MKYNFDEIIPRRGTNSYKWDSANDADILPMWVADMDFQTAPEILERLEPELKIFRFEKSDAFFETLSEEQQKEERMNIRNGMNFARKVLSTGECDLVILDEVLGLLDQGIIEMDEMKTLLQSRVEEIDLILTGKVFPKELDPFVDGIREIDHLKVDNTKQ